MRLTTSFCNNCLPHNNAFNSNPIFMISKHNKPYDSTSVLYIYMFTRHAYTWQGMLAGVPLPAGFSISCRLESFSAVGVCKSRTLILAVVHYFLHHSSPSAIFLLCLSVCYIITITISSSFILRYYSLQKHHTSFPPPSSYSSYQTNFNTWFIIHVAAT